MVPSYTRFKEHGAPNRSRGEIKMSNSYAAVSALIFTIVAIMHLVRIVSRWSVVIGPRNIPMNVSWAGLVVAALLAIWGFMQLG